MAKITSCGIVVKYDDKYVIGHVSGQHHHDIFKGKMNDGETWADTAIRECKEESGLAFTESDIKFLGHFNYTQKKNLVVYIAKIQELDVDSLICTTYLENSRPEMDYYSVVSFDELIQKTGKNMSRILKSLENDILNY